MNVHAVERASVATPRRFAIRPWLPTYRRLLLGVMLANVLVLARHAPGWRISDGSALSALSALALVNVTGAVLVRQQVLLNLLYGAVGRGSPEWPLGVRWAISRVHHVGGLHAGFALAATGWLSAVQRDGVRRRQPPTGQRVDAHARALRRPRRRSPSW